MLTNTEVLKSLPFVMSELALFASSAICILIFPGLWGVWLVFFVITSFIAYIVFEQQRKIAILQDELELQRTKEDEYILRTEQLRRALHDVRSPLSALKLRLQIMQKTNGEADKMHLVHLEDSLNTAVDQVLMMSDIQKGKIKPSETMQFKLDEIRAHLSK